MKKLTPETIVKKQVRGYLRIRGWFVFHVLQGLGAYPGISDFIAMKNGRVIFVECKAPKGTQSDQQKQFQRCCEVCGVTYILARSVEDLIPTVG